MRRNFTQLAQKHANIQQTNLLTGHSASSTVQWKNYASTFEKLDVDIEFAGIISTYPNNENGPPQSGEKCDRRNGDRLNTIIKYMLLSTKVKGIHQCRWCQEDERHAAIYTTIILSRQTSKLLVRLNNDLLFMYSEPLHTFLAWLTITKLLWM